MAADAQEGSPSTEVTEAEAREKEIHDTGFDLGWEAGQGAMREGFKETAAEARMEGYQEGFTAGFKEGRIVGKNEQQTFVTTWPTTIPPNTIWKMVSGTAGPSSHAPPVCQCDYCRNFYNNKP